MNELRQMLLEAFQVEYADHLEGIRTSLAGQPPNLDEAFRRAHSLKAAARVCDLDPIAALSQRLESLFSRARANPANRHPATDVAGSTVPGSGLAPEASQAVWMALEAIENWVRLQNSGVPPDITPVLEVLDQALARKDEGKRTKDPSDEEGLGLKGEVLAAFLVEYREHLETIRAILAEIETHDSKPGQIDEIFRRAHSLKGAARIAEVRSAEMVAHRLESLFAEIREGRVLTGPTIEAIHQGLDFIEDAVAALMDGRVEPDPASPLQAIANAPGEPSTQSQRSEGEPATSVAGLPPSVAGSVAAPVEAVRVSLDHLDQLLRSAEHLLAEGLNQDIVLRELIQIERQVSEWSRGGQAMRRGKKRRGALGAEPEQQLEEQLRSLARQIRRVRRLHQNAAHSLRQLSRILQNDVRRVRMVSADSILGAFRKMMRGLADELGKEVEFRATGLEVQADRMVLQALKDPLMHILRNALTHGIEAVDERRRLGKNPRGLVSLHLAVLGNQLQIRVEDDGRGIDYRRVMTESVKQGILSQEQAQTAGPEQLARLLFRPGFSTAEGVTDLAGRGMGLSVVEETVARLQGEVSLGEPNSATPQSENPTGTCIILTVPLFISALRLLLVECQDQTFAVPFPSIESLSSIRYSQIAPGQRTLAGRPVLFLKDRANTESADEPVPFHNLSTILGLGSTAQVGDGSRRVPRDEIPVLVLRSGTRRLAIAVDAFVGECDTLVKDLDVPARSETWTGAILREDGSVVLVLNPSALFCPDAAPSGEESSELTGSTFGTRKEEGENDSGAAVLPPSSHLSEGSKKKLFTILVVDDSLTTRTLEKSILEAHGYKVRVALDGLEALASLRLEPVDLVITDVQMPRLDGFGLLEAMKRDEGLARVPVIVVTSLEKREDQERGLALGADAYVVKRKFDHEELLQTIQQLI